MSTVTASSQSGLYRTADKFLPCTTAVPAATTGPQQCRFWQWMGRSGCGLLSACVLGLAHIGQRQSTGGSGARWPMMLDHDRPTASVPSVRCRFFLSHSHSSAAASTAVAVSCANTARCQLCRSCFLLTTSSQMSAWSGVDGGGGGGGATTVSFFPGLVG